MTLEKAQTWTVDRFFENNLVSKSTTEKNEIKFSIARNGVRSLPCMNENFCAFIFVKKDIENDSFGIIYFLIFWHFSKIFVGNYRAKFVEKGWK